MDIRETIFFIILLEISGHFTGTLARRCLPALAESLPPKSYNLTMCAMVRNEMPYILEWIEHHRLQGVDRFLLYDDDSQDDTVLIPHLYRSRGFPDLVELLPVNPYRFNQPPPHLGTHHDQKQRYVLDHCNRRSVNVSRWVIVVDVDEFMYAPKHGTIPAFLDSKAAETEKPVPEGISQFYVLSVRYGTSGLQQNFRGRIVMDPYRALVEVSAEDPNGNNTQKGFPLITVANPYRAPHGSLDQDHDARYNETCRNHKDPAGCIHANGKSVWKPDRCGTAGVHWCEKGLRGKGVWADLKELRVNHYAFKSREHVEGLLDLLKPIKNAAYTNFDKVWFSSRFDPMPASIVMGVQRAVQKFAQFAG